MKRNDFSLVCILFLIIAIGNVVYGQTRKVNQRSRSTSNQDVLFLTQEQETEVIQYIKEVHPEQLEGLLDLKETRPMMYRRMLSKGYREMRLMNELKERDPKRYKRVAEERTLDGNSRALARKYRSAEGTEKERLREEIKQILDQIFDMRQVNRVLEIERLEKKINELKNNNLERLKNKDEILKRRLTELLGEDKGKEW